MWVCGCAAQKGGGGRDAIATESPYALPGASWISGVHSVGVLQVTHRTGARKPTVHCNWWMNPKPPKSLQLPSKGLLLWKAR